MPFERAEKAAHDSIENIVKEKLMHAGILNKYPNLQIRFIGENIVASGINDAVTVFDRVENGEAATVFNIIDIREDPFFAKSAYYAGFREIKTEYWFALYRIKDVDITTWRPLLGVSPIDPHGLEYFHAWESVAFLNDRFAIAAWKQVQKDGTYQKISNELLDALASSGAARPKDLRFFIDHGQIGEAAYISHLSTAKRNLVTQIGKNELEAVNDRVRQEEIDICFIEGIFSNEEHTLLSGQLKEYEKKTLSKGTTKTTIQYETKRQLKP